MRQLTDESAPQWLANPMNHFAPEAGDSFELPASRAPLNKPEIS